MEVFRSPARAQRSQTLCRLAQCRLEATDAETNQAALDLVDDARALPHQILALAVWPSRILLLKRRDRRHVAMVRLAAQPANEGALQELGVEPVCLRPSMLAGDSDARRMDNMGFDIAHLQPARQPEAVAASFKSNRDARDRTASLGSLIPPTLQQSQQRLLVRLELLQGVPLDTWNDPGDEPAREAHFDDRDECVILLKGGEGPA